MLFRVQVSFAPGFDYGDEMDLDPDDPQVQASVDRGELRPVEHVLPDGGWRPGYSTIPPGTAAVPVDPADFIEHVRSFDGAGEPDGPVVANKGEPPPDASMPPAEYARVFPTAARMVAGGPFVPDQPETL